MIVSPLNGEFISTNHIKIPEEKCLITFSPTIFTKPEKPLNAKLASIMMPFAKEFDATFDTLCDVTNQMELECQRADSIFNNTTIIQDIFELIYYSKVVVVDFTGKNPNVMYETGIAHTLGKTVIPITQSIDYVPSDLGHHKAITYLPNEQGLKSLKHSLCNRLNTVYEKL